MILNLPRHLRVTQPRNRSLRAESELAIRPCSSCIWFVYVYKLNKALPDYFASFSTKRYQIPLSYFMWFEIQNSKTFTKMSNLLTHCLPNVVEFRERKKDISLPDMRNFFNRQTMQLCGHPPPELEPSESRGGRRGRSRDLEETIEWRPLCITDLFMNKLVAYF